MKPYLLPVAALALAAAGASFAAVDPAAAPAKPRACFHAGSVSGYTNAGEETLYVRVGARDVYRLDLMGRCNGLDDALRIGLDTRGSSWVCSPLDVTVVTGSSIGPQRCPVTALSKLTEAEVAALPGKDRP